MPVRLSDLRKTADAAIDADGLDSAQVTTIAQAAGLSYLSTLDSLPTAGLTSGDQAFVQANQRLYISNGTGWYNVSLINLTPQFDSDINSTFSIVDSQTPLIITNPASDSDNPDAIITYGGTLSDSGQYLIALTRDSSVWTFTPLSADSVHSNVTLGNIPDSAGGDFTYTFTATDGINTATKAITITYDGLAAAAYSPMGSNHGYTSGGFGGGTPSYPNAVVNTIDRYPFASDANATDVGDLTGNRYNHGVGQSDTVAVVAAGRTAPSATYTNQIQSYAFASSSNASDTGHDTPATWPKGSSQTAPIGNGTKTYFWHVNYAYSYDFASNASQTAQIAPSTSYDNHGGEASSDTNGYLAGNAVLGGYGYVHQNTIQRFPFASDTSVTDVGDLAAAKSHATGNNSSTHGYASGGASPPIPSPNKVNTIHKFAFASDGNAADVGDVSLARVDMAGSSSPVSGYQAGGEPLTNEIQKFPFASDGNTTDVGDITVTRMGTGGHSN